VAVKKNGDYKQLQDMRLEVWGEYQKRRPQKGAEYNLFCDEMAQRYRCTRQKIRDIVTRQIESFDLQYRETAHTIVHQAAQAHGVTYGRVFKALIDSLAATRKDPIYEDYIEYRDEPENWTDDVNAHRFPGTNIHKGTRRKHYRMRRALRDEKGNFVYFEQPDWRTRTEATKHLLDILGMRAPEELTVHATHNVNLTTNEADLDKQLREVTVELRRLAPEVFALEGIPTVDRPEERFAGAEKRPLLGVSLHEDKRRARRDGKSVQAVSPEASLPLRDPGTGQPSDRGHNRFHQEKPNDDGDMAGGGVGSPQDLHPSGNNGDDSV
jgi:hypothetical protein